MTKFNSQSKHSVRQLSSTEEGAPEVAGPEEPSQSVAAPGIADEIEEEFNEDSAARDPKIARRPVRPSKGMVWCTNFITRNIVIGATIAELEEEWRTSIGHRRVTTVWWNSQSITPL